jgi:hypothetical protein
MIRKKEKKKGEREGGKGEREEGRKKDKTSLSYRRLQITFVNSLPVRRGAYYPLL